MYYTNNEKGKNYGENNCKNDVLIKNQIGMKLDGENSLLNKIVDTNKCQNSTKNTPSLGNDLKDCLDIKRTEWSDKSAKFCAKNGTINRYVCSSDAKFIKYKNGFPLINKCNIKRSELIDCLYNNFNKTFEELTFSKIFGCAFAKNSGGFSLTQNIFVPKNIDNFRYYIILQQYEPDLPKAVFDYELFSQRLATRYLQKYGYKTIPFVCWQSNIDTEIFDSIPKNSIIAITTQGVNADNRKNFLKGLFACISRVCPELIICIGKRLPEMECIPSLYDIQFDNEKIEEINAIKLQREKTNIKNAKRRGQRILSWLKKEGYDATNVLASDAEAYAKQLAMDSNFVLPKKFKITNLSKEINDNIKKDNHFSDCL